MPVSVAFADEVGGALGHHDMAALVFARTMWGMTAAAAARRMMISLFAPTGV